MYEMLNRFQNRLKDNGYSSTKTRQTVFLTLLSEKPLSLVDLIEKIGSKADRASIYRSIQLFEKIGVVQRLQIGWKYKLELTDSFASHHHHMTCTRCTRITTIPESAELENLIAMLSEQRHFQHNSHQLEISGLCKNCTHLN